MKELRKGNKVPYHGYLLNVTEYEKYSQFLCFLEKYKPLLDKGFLDSF